MKRVIATQTATRLTRYECRSCGHRCEARVRTDGSGVAPLYKPDIDHSIAKAREAAERDFDTNVQTTLMLARCPKCKKRDGGALANLAAWTLVPTLFLGGFAYWLFVIGGPAFFFGLVMGVAALAVVRTGVRSIGRADRDVVFEL